MIQQKLAKFSQISGIINNIFRPTLGTQMFTNNVHNTLALAILLYWSEIWTSRRKRGKKNTDIITDENFSE